MDKDINSSLKRLNDTIAREAKTNREEGKYEHSFKRLQDIATLVLGIVTLGFVIATTIGIFRQASTMQDATEDAHNAYTQVQRAFITVNDFQQTLSGTESDPLWILTPIIKNSGNTPTKNMFFMGDVVTVLNGSALNGSQPYDPDYIKTITRTILGPQAILPTHTFSAPLTKKSLEILITPTSYFDTYIMGSIHYWDVFLGTDEHVTKFCYQVKVEKKENGTLIPYYNLCRHWNCADDQCTDDRKIFDAEMRNAKEAEERTK